MLSTQGLEAPPIYEIVTPKIITFVKKKADGGKRIFECRAKALIDS